MSMKTIQLLLVLFMVGIPTVKAQNYKMVLKKTDGTIYEFPVDEIKELAMEEIIPDLPLYVTVSENEMIDPSTSAKSKRTKARAPITTTSTLTSFTLHGKGYDYALSKSSTKWTANPDYWPRRTDGDEEVTFYAHSAGDYHPEGNYIQFNVDNNAFVQHDLLVATKTTSRNASNGVVNLTFDHACAAVLFNICMTNKLKTKLGAYNLTVKSVVLKDVCNTGEYHFSGGWNNKAKNEFSNFVLTNSKINVSTELEPLPCGYLFMIPQTMDGAARLEIVYTIGASEEEKTATIPLSNISWAAGCKYTVNIKLGTSTIQI